VFKAKLKLTNLEKYNFFILLQGTILLKKNGVVHVRAKKCVVTHSPGEMLRPFAEPTTAQTM
jgi:hypothetical protein